MRRRPSFVRIGGSLPLGLGTLALATAGLYDDAGNSVRAQRAITEISNAVVSPPLDDAGGG